MSVETDDINPRFLSYYFLTNQHKAFMISMCSHGTTMASLNQKILEQIDFPCLERNYQDKIVEILSKIDEKGRVLGKVRVIDVLIVVFILHYGHKVKIL